MVNPPLSRAPTREQFFVFWSKLTIFGAFFGVLKFKKRRLTDLGMEKTAFNAILSPVSRLEPSESKIF